MKIIKAFIIVFAVFFSFSSCAILDQGKEMKTFAKCEFRLKNIDNLLLAGVDVQDVQSMSDLSFTEASQISMTALKGELPLTFTLNLEVKNPNDQKASLNGMYWILYIDDIEITEGRVGDKVTVPPDGGITTMPVDMQFDLFEVLSGKSSEAVMNFGLNLAGAGGYPSRVKLKIKPTIVVAMTKVNYPGYFTIEEEFVSQ